jgi:hypothetical protein
MELLVVAVLVLAAGFWLSLHLQPLYAMRGVHRHGEASRRSVQVSGCTSGGVHLWCPRVHSGC